MTRILSFSSLIMLLCNLKRIKPLENEEMTTNKSPLNEVSIKRMLRNNEALKSKYVAATRAEKGKAKMKTTKEDISHDNEAWLKMLELMTRLMLLLVH
ncbi:hypothetical protein V6N11_035447 [Hibiscus sabdariffa]|uniref:Uncharacterized protein n=2 Tax=Hibiscus sabdariffa TaxID=183260 RepID=A0ABR2R0B0_9ROSI